MKTVAVCIILAVFVLLSVVAIAGPTITIYTDAETYQSGDAIEVSLSAQNVVDGMSVDVYIGLITPDWDIYAYGPGGWTDSLEPWIPDIYVPSGFGMDRTPLWWFDVPCSMPPISEQGQYYFASVLTHPGTLEWVSQPSLALFTVGASAVPNYYVNGETGDDSNDGSESYPWRTITHALASALSTPATIHVAAGTYAASTNGETFPLNMKSWASLIGDHRETTILDAEDSAYHVILCDGADAITIEGFTITGGYANGSKDRNARGAGICCYESSPTILNNTITRNSSDGQYSYGGGIYCYESSPIISNNTITDNSAYYGGGIHCSDSWPTISNNTIIGNSARYGGGIRCDHESSPTILDCIIWANGDDLLGCSASYCCIEDGDSGTGNIHDDPMFVSGPQGEYYLDPDSPCIDAGSRSASEAGLSDRTTQADGTPDTGTVDMGFHYPVP